MVTYTVGYVFFNYFFMNICKIFMNKINFLIEIRTFCVFKDFFKEKNILQFATLLIAVYSTVIKKGLKNLK